MWLPVFPLRPLGWNSGRCAGRIIILLVIHSLRQQKDTVLQMLKNKNGSCSMLIFFDIRKKSISAEILNCISIPFEDDRYSKLVRFAMPLLASLVFMN